MKLYSLLSVTVATLALHAGPLHAQSVTKSASPSGGSSALASELVARRVVVGEDGKEAKQKADTVKPGDLIEYAANYKNTTRLPLADFTATLPVPAGTVYVAESGQPRGAMASVDGVRFEPMPLRRKVKQPDGRVAEVAVPLSEYRALRWPARPLGAQEQIEASLRVRVVDQTRTAATTLGRRE